MRVCLGSVALSKSRAVLDFKIGITAVIDQKDHTCCAGRRGVVHTHLAFSGVAPAGAVIDRDRRTVLGVVRTVCVAGVDVVGRVVEGVAFACSECRGCYD